MKEFKFVMNEYKNVCYVYVDVNKPPIDTMYLTQHLERNKPHEAGEIKSGWTPQCFQIKNILNFRTADIEKMKRFYNEFYDEIHEVFFPKDLLNLPEKISGYCLDYESNEIAKVNGMRHDEAFGVVCTHSQAKGIAAFCEVSHILPIFNEGWEPDWDADTIKQCIRTFENGAIQVYGTFDFRSFLAFETEEKAMLFLKEKIDLITDLSKAGII
jgi:hypothetical protein